MKNHKELTLKTQLLVNQMAIELVSNPPQGMKINKANIAEQISISLEFKHCIYQTPETIERDYLGVYSELKTSLS